MPTQENEWVKSDLDQLKIDTKACLEEIGPILQKYDLEIVGVIRSIAKNMAMAVMEFARPKKKKS